MNSREMSLKARIRNYAKKSGLTAQVVLQNFSCLSGFLLGSPGNRNSIKKAIPQ